MNVYFIIYYFMFLIWQILYPIGLLDLVWIDRKQIKNEWMKKVAASFEILMPTLHYTTLHN
jgi:hypothetical protein